MGAGRFSLYFSASIFLPFHTSGLLGGVLCRRSLPPGFSRSKNLWRTFQPFLRIKGGMDTCSRPLEVTGLRPGDQSVVWQVAIMEEAKPPAQAELQCRERNNLLVVLETVNW